MCEFGFSICINVCVYVCLYMHTEMSIYILTRVWFCVAAYLHISVYDPTCVDNGNIRREHICIGVLQSFQRCSPVALFAWELAVP